MVKIPGKDGRKIETVHAKLLKVRQLLTDARQIASKVVLPRGRGIPWVQRMGMRRRATADEPFGKDLVVYRAHGPFGRRDHIAGIDLKQLEEARCGFPVRNAVLTVEMFLARKARQAEKVFDVVRLLRKGHFRGPLGVRLVLCADLQGPFGSVQWVRALPADKAAPFDVVAGRQQTEADRISCNRLPKQQHGDMFNSGNVHMRSHPAA